MKPIIKHIFESYQPRLTQLSSRPFLKALINGLTIKYEQNSEPPPPVPATENDTSTRAGRGDDAEEEAYFDASDDEPEIGPHLEIPAKRKRGSGSGSGSGITPGGQGMVRSNKRQGLGPRQLGLGLDYGDDNSEEDDSGSSGSSPKTPLTSTVPVPIPAKEEEEGKPVESLPALEGELGDVAMRMRAKREREEEDEESEGLVLASSSKKKEKEKEEKSGIISTPTKKTISTLKSTTPSTKMDMTKRIKLSLFGKKDKDKEKDKDKDKDKTVEGMKEEQKDGVEGATGAGTSAEGSKEDAGTNADSAQVGSQS